LSQNYLFLAGCNIRNGPLILNLIRFWLGHGVDSVTDCYATIADEKGWRKTEAEKAGIGFALPTSVVPIVPKMHHIRAIEIAA
jgi:hypothetical protein